MRLNKWMARTSKVPPQAYMILGQAYYQLKQYNNALKPILKGISLTKAAGKPVKENWYLILYTIYYEKGRLQENC